MKRKVLIGTAVILLLIFGYSIWYLTAYSMDEAKPYFVGLKSRDQKVFIATQGSEYKNTLVKRLTDFLDSEEVYVEVKDVSTLRNVETEDWDAIIILHTWEMWKPEGNSKTFLESNYDAQKVFVVSTSGAGDEKIEGVDAITGASVLSEVPDHFNQLKQKLVTALEL
jgi:hypothetical protein